MFLYLIRHGEARSELEDPERGLTEKGFRDVSAAAVRIHERGIRVESIYHSGKKRALQTALILAARLAPRNGVSAADGLLPMDDPDQWAERLDEMHEDIMLVGHLPHLEKLAGLLLMGDQGNAPVGFQTAGGVCLRRFDDGHWHVGWSVRPETVQE